MIFPELAFRWYEFQTALWLKDTSSGFVEREIEWLNNLYTFNRN